MIAIALFVLLMMLVAVQPVASQGPVLEFGPKRSSAYPVPDTSGLGRGIEKMGEALGRIKREKRKRQEKERVQAALTKVLEAGLKGFGGLPPGPDAALLAAVENPKALSHPNFHLIMNLLRTRTSR